MRASAISRAWPRRHLLMPAAARMDRALLRSMVGDHLPTAMRADHFRDRRGVAGRTARPSIDHHVVVVRQPPRERLETLARHPDPAQPHDPAVVQHHRLGEHAVGVQAHHPHRPASAYCRDPREPAGNTATTDPRSRRLIAARSMGEPQGRPDNGLGSRPIVQGSACPHARAPGAPCPGWLHHSAGPEPGQRDIRTPRASCRLMVRWRGCTEP